MNRRGEGTWSGLLTYVSEINLKVIERLKSFIDKLLILFFNYSSDDEDDDDEEENNSKETSDEKDKRGTKWVNHHNFRGFWGRKR